MGELKAERLWDAKDVAEFANVKLSWVWKETREGNIPKVKNMGKLFRYDPEVIRKYFSTDTKKKNG